ncbi:uncharacterized protein LOC106722684, partial [Alligator sinensis]|uniref:ribonuclease H n=1 Tax=Alligator sinensis TaxID=38654 RepID=A0A1U8DGJ2_ALLSI
MGDTSCNTTVTEQIQLLPGAQPPCVKQYAMRMEARKGLKPLVERFLEYGLLRECTSAFNTPILPVNKPKSDEYHFVQDLRAVNKVVVSIYPVVPNPYTLLSALNPNHNWFTVIDLKDVFFCIPVERGSQEIFAFEWEDPDTSIKTQFCWTVLPQGFKNSPTLFGTALSKDLHRLKLPLSCALLQYVDDLAILLDKPEIKLAISRTVNPATLLPPMADTPDLVHDCLQTLEAVYSSRPNLRDKPLENAELEFYTDGSSSMENGIRKSGYAILTTQNVIEAGPLNPSVSAQKAELIAMTQALQLAANKTVNIYTDSKYVFLVLHAHRALWKERGLLDAKGASINHSKQIKALLKAVWELKEVAVMHCKAHQKGNDPSTKGNRFADVMAKRAAKRPQTDLLPEVSNLLPLLPDLYQPVT